MVREKSVLMPIVLRAESAAGAAMLMAVPISMLSMTVLYRFPDVVHAGTCNK